MPRLVLSVVLLLTACESRPPANEHAMAARRFTSVYAESSLAKWEVHAIAAGPDCSVLLIETAMVLDDSLVEAMHYGAGPYGVYDGHGVQKFSDDESFRGVAYRDSLERMWTYGVDATEAKSLAPCR